MPRTFDCPKCGAPVEFTRNPLDPSHTAKCNYCNSVLAEPTMGRPAHVIHVNLENATKNIKFPKWILLIFLIPLLGVAIGVIALFAGLAPLFVSGKKTNTPPTFTRANNDTPKGGTRPEPSFATTLLKFGSEGIGPGMFTDARSIAVDGEGNIYVGEYSGGRIQVFDSAGKFITQWTADAKMPLRGLASDRKGTVYVVQRGAIQKFEGKTGKPLGEVKFSEGSGFDDITIAADGSLIAAWSRNSDDIVKFDSSGNFVKSIKKAISSVTERSELDHRVAVDGKGNIYALGHFNSAVFKFTPDGKYVNKFGGQGDKAGQFRAPGCIAVDGHGKVYVSDFQGIQVFDSEGRFLRAFKPDGGHASGMVFNDNNELFVVDRTKVVKVALKE